MDRLPLLPSTSWAVGQRSLTCKARCVYLWFRFCEWTPLGGLVWYLVEINGLSNVSALPGVTFTCGSLLVIATTQSQSLRRNRISWEQRAPVNECHNKPIQSPVPDVNSPSLTRWLARWLAPCRHRVGLKLSLAIYLRYTLHNSMTQAAVNRAE